MAEEEGIRVEILVINDDVAVKDSLYTIGRRGVVHLAGHGRGLAHHVKLDDEIAGLLDAPAEAAVRVF